MNKNGEALYNTRNTRNYHDGNTWFTENRNTGYRYALVCLSGQGPNPGTVEWKGNVPREGSKIKLLQTGESLKWTQKDGRVTVYLPASIINAKESYPALAFSFIAL